MTERAWPLFFLEFLKILEKQWPTLAKDEKHKVAVNSTLFGIEAALIMHDTL